MKSPAISAILGLLFGAFGVGIYLQSWKIFFICFAIQLVILFIPVPPLNFAASWAFAAIFGYIKASEARLGV